MRAFSEHWAERFPRWQRGVCAPVFWARPDNTFSFSEAHADTGFIFHVIIEFAPKWPGAFTADIVITESTEPFPGNPPWFFKESIPKFRPGTCRLGWFFADRDLWWHLMDEAAESKRFWATVPTLSDPPLLKRQEGHWYAPSYDVPLKAIIAKAVQDFSDSFEQHVVPKLLSTR